MPVDDDERVAVWLELAVSVTDEEGVPEWLELMVPVLLGLAVFVTDELVVAVTLELAVLVPLLLADLEREDDAVPDWLGLALEEVSAATSTESTATKQIRARDRSGSIFSGSIWKEGY